MKIQTKFQILIKANRKLFLAAGYKPARLTMWTFGNRHPRFEDAKKLAMLLNISIDEIPWVRWQKNS